MLLVVFQLSVDVLLVPAVVVEELDALSLGLALSLLYLFAAELDNSLLSLVFLFHVSVILRTEVFDGTVRSVEKVRELVEVLELLGLFVALADDTLEAVQGRLNASVDKVLVYHLVHSFFFISGHVFAVLHLFFVFIPGLLTLILLDKLIIKILKVSQVCDRVLLVVLFAVVRHVEGIVVDSEHLKVGLQAH